MCDLGSQLGWDVAATNTGGVEMNEFVVEQGRALGHVLAILWPSMKIAAVIASWPLVAWGFLQIHGLIKRRGIPMPK